MTALPDFDLREPGTVAEAVAVLADDAAEARPIAGGTALLLLMRYGYLWPGTLVSLRRLDDELGGVARDADGTLRIGATTTLRRLERSEVVATHAPVVVETLAHLANVRVRNAATLGGHLVHADPHMDLPPVLMALDAQVDVVGAGGDRSIPVAQLYAGYYDTVLADGDLVTHVRIPPAAPGSRATYRKFTALSADDWPTLGVAVNVDLADGRVRRARVALGAVGDRVRRVGAAEAVLDGAQPSPRLCGEAAEAAAAAIADDADDYTVRLVEVQVRRALAAVCLVGPDGRDAPRAQDRRRSAR